MDNTFSFDKIVARRHSSCVKWDEMPGDDVIPLWVADMDFEAAPCILRALQERLDHGVFGYTLVPDRYYEALTSWHARRHHWTIEREWVIYTSGVVPALSATLKGLCEQGDEVVVLTPVYNCFFSSIRNNGLRALEVPLLDEAQRIDFPALKAALERKSARALLLCNPHNPGGRVWTREELQTIAELCRDNGVWLLSDEIHCELVFEGHEFVSVGTLGAEVLSRSVVFNSPSKSFNIAGLQIANIICADADARRRIDRAINDNEVCDVNPFGVAAFIAAYEEGEPWLQELLRYIRGNYEYLCCFFAEHLPQLRVAPLEGTYLAWVNISATGETCEALTERLLREARVAVNAGTMYGAAGRDHIRINLACPRSLLAEALQRVRDELKVLC